ncbi:MAG: methyltransferase [Anaerolineaceae bacterium]|nr:methyltransferase [Anaerolineaceae bacterium]
MSEEKSVNLFEMSDLCTPWCLHVVVTLRMAEHMAAGIHKIEDLAAAASCDPTALQQVLGHLASKGVFDESTAGCFSLNEAAQQLLDPGLRLGLDLDGIGGRMAYSWGSLLSYVRTGAPAYKELFGLPFWEDLDAHPELAASFDALIGPGGHGGSFNADFQITGGWEAVRTVVDVGGGTGSMLAELLRLRPNLHGILVDQANTVARSAAILEAAGVRERVSTVGQSFFDALPAGADLYLLRGVLNDWPDREALAILRRCAEAAGPSGRVVVLKSVGADEARNELGIEMVMLGGRRRSAAEFRELARQAGLEILGAGQQPSGYFVVECRTV